MPMNRALYPPEWPAIARRIRQRAGDRCEGSPMYPDCRAAHGEPHPVTGSTVVITVGHLNHVEMDCRDENLRAWCQRCHLTYDAAHHAKNAARTRRERNNNQTFTFNSAEREER